MQELIAFFKIKSKKTLRKFAQKYSPKTRRESHFKLTIQRLHVFINKCVPTP